MTEMVLGRCEFEEGPESVEQSGDVLTISGDLVCATYAELTMRRLQLNGMVNNPDEDVFPCTFVAMPELDGFYAVESVSVGSTPVMTAAAVVPYSVTLRRVQAAHAPTVEIDCRFPTRTNAHGLSSGLINTGAFRNTALVGWSSAIASASRTTNDAVGLGRIDTSAASLTHAGSPSAHYAGVVRVEVQADDGNWYPMTGTDMPPVAIDKVRLSNGLMRMSFTAAGLIAVSHWTGTVWSTVNYTHSITTPAAYSASGAERPTIIRNGLDYAAIRAWVALSGVSERNQVTLSLYTGDRIGTATVTRNGSATLRMGFTTVPGGGLTTITGAMHHTANDADGNRPILMCPNGSGATGTGIWTGGTTSETFCFGNAIGGGSATTFDTVTALRNQFYNPYLTATTVVAR